MARYVPLSIATLLLLTLALHASLAPAHARELTLEQRVVAQGAVESFYQRHRLGSTSGELPAEVLLVRKAEQGVRLSLALERFWGTTVTDAMLERELERMVRDTRMPERLRGLFAALDNDRFLIKETIVRHAVANRLARRFYEAGERSASWERWWNETSPELSPAAFAPTATGGAVPAVDGTGCNDGDWVSGSLDDVPDPRRLASAVWTGAEMIVWGGFNSSIPLQSGGRYDPVIDDWQPTSRARGAPSARYYHTAVWTGSEMIVWGGATTPGGGFTNTGARYDPVADSWQAIDDESAPSPRWRHTAVWTGSEMIVWGGPQLDGDGARYDPASDSWTRISDVGDPSGRKDHTAVWTGSEMVIWGGSENDLAGNTPDSGGRYDPATDSWSPTSTFQPPPGRARHTAVWTGTTMLVWGGQIAGGLFTGSGGVYDPAVDVWTPVSPVAAPSARGSHAAVWTGDRMLIWGGQSGLGELGDGASYDPATGNWTPLISVGAPAPRGDLAYVWDGSRLIVWGGSGLRDFNSGGRYDPIADAWTPTTTEGAPFPRRGQTGVWTGSEMLIWGGTASTSLDTGSRYDPATDTWTEMTTSNAPEGRSFHSAIWAGDRLLVWGGNAGLQNGGRYDPVADSWSPTSLANAPTGRRGHSAIWTGAEMLVWGGWSGGTYFGDGSRYDPAADTWAPVSSVGAPAGSERHTAVWTGDTMVVWGGITASGFTQGGGRYDPSQDLWAPVDTSAAPTPRTEHSAIWTGSQMVVWGGTDTIAQAVKSGGRYDPVADSWLPTEDDSGATPPARRNHVAVWSGSEMLIWGGRVPASPMDDYPRLGGRYDPASDSWTPIPEDGSPPGRNDASVVWTGDTMIVWGGAAATLAELGSGGAYCGCASSEFFRDGDGDGFGDAGDSVSACQAPAGFVDDASDCDDGNGDLWGTPGEAIAVGWPDRDTLAWSPPLNPGAATLLYDVIRSGDPADFATGSCVATDLGATAATASGAPAPAELFAYLVRAENGCPLGAGDLGSASDGMPRTATGCP